MFCDGSVGTIGCFGVRVVMRQENMGITARLGSFSQSRLRHDIAYILMTHTPYTLYTFNIYQLKFKLSLPFKRAQCGGGPSSLSVEVHIKYVCQYKRGCLSLPLSHSRGALIRQESY